MVHSPLSRAPAGDAREATTVLVAAVDTAGEADRAIADGADMIDGSALTEEAMEAILTRHPRARVWLGTPAVVDADQAAAAPGEAGAPHEPTQPDAPAAPAPVAAVVAVAAILTWRGTPAIRTRHVVAVRRAIDMTRSIAGIRPPTLTTRGLA